MNTVSEAFRKLIPCSFIRRSIADFVNDPAFTYYGEKKSPFYKTHMRGVRIGYTCTPKQGSCVFKTSVKWNTPTHMRAPEIALSINVGLDDIITNGRIDAFSNAVCSHYQDLVTTVAHFLENDPDYLARGDFTLRYAMRKKVAFYD